MKYFILLFLIIQINVSKADALTDSLEKVVQTQRGLEKIKALNKLASSYFQRDYGKTAFYYSLSLREASLNNDTFHMALAYANLASNNYQLRNFKNALDTFEIAERLYKSINYKVGLVFVYSQIANVYNAIGQIEKSVEHYTKALQQYSFQEILDSASVIVKIPDATDYQKRIINVYSLALNDFGLMYNKLFLRDKAIELFLKSKKLAEASNRKDRLAAALSNIGLAYIEKKDYQSAEKFFFEAESILKETQMVNYLANTYLSIANLYFAKEDYKKSLDYSLKAHQIFTKIKDSLTGVWNMIGRNYTKLKKFSEAKNYLSIGERLYKERNYKSLLLQSYFGLAEYYEAKNDWKSAFYYKSLYSKAKEEIYEEEQNEKISNLLAFFEINAKQQEVDLLKKDVELNKLQLKKNENEIFIIVITAILLALLLAGSVFLYSMKSRNKKAIEEKNIQLEKALEELREINQTKDKFFSIIAHDIKNPIASVKQVTELLTNDFIEISEEEKKEFMDSLHTSSINLLNLLDNLLTWARSQTGKLNPKKTELSVKSILREQIEIIRPAAEDKEIDIIVNVDDFKSYGDYNMISTVIRNLLSNAVKFTRNKGRVEINTEVSNGFGNLSIKDNGVGISQEMMDKLFRLGKNRSTLGTNKEEGTGLGLILCREFVEKNGGKINVESTIGEGSTFSFSLPVADYNKIST